MLLRLPLISLDANLLILLNGACLIPGVPSLMPAPPIPLPNEAQTAVQFGFVLSDGTIFWGCSIKGKKRTPSICERCPENGSPILTKPHVLRLTFD